MLHEPRFVDLAPAEVYATLLDEGATSARSARCTAILAANAEVRERRDQLRHPAYAAPSCWPAGPTSCGAGTSPSCSGPAKWTYFYLYVILDVFSRYVVGWMVAQRESATLAEQLIARDAARSRASRREQLTLHADRGSSMTSKPVALLLADLGVTKTHRRPHVSNDNPFSEAQFKTLKYRPGLPRPLRLDRGRPRLLPAPSSPGTTPSITTAASACSRPHDVHYGLAEQRVAARATVLAAAYAAHPERFSGGLPQPPARPTEVWINPPNPERPSATRIPVNPRSRSTPDR